MAAPLRVSRTLLNSYPLLAAILGIMSFIQLNSHIYVLAQDPELDSDPANPIFPNVLERRYFNGSDDEDESLPPEAPSNFSGSTGHETESKTELPIFLFPSANPVSECNLWGPLCQPGSIVVDVLTANITAKTTVPCSSYLSEQSRSYFEARYGAENRFFASYSSSFFQSPECTSYAKWIVNGGRGSVFPYSNCLDSMSVDQDNRVNELEMYFPGGAGPRYGSQICCGPCAILIDEIQVLYFPEKDSPARCGQKPLGTVTAKPNITSNALRQREVAGDEDGIAIVDGYTLTSPSFYLQIIGTARVINDCGRVGAVYTNPIVPVAAGDLSTISLNLPLGATFHDTDRGDMEAFTKPVKVADLDCPSWGINNSPGPYRTVGPPFNPIILPPIQLISIDFDWIACAYSDVAWVGSNGICKSLRNEVFDPPRRLTPAAALAPPITMAVAATPTAELPSPRKNNNNNAAMPAKTADPALPAITERPDPKLPPYSEPKDAESDAEPGTGQDPSGQDPQAKSEQAASIQQHGGSKPNSPGGAGTTPNSNEASKTDPASEPVPNLNLGEIIYNAFGRNNNNNNKKPIKPSPQPPIITTTSFFQTLPIPLSTSFPTTIVIPTPGGSGGGGGRIATILNPSSLALSGTTISIGGGPFTILPPPATATAAAAKEEENANIMILSLAPENKILIGTVFLASQQSQPLPTLRPEEVLFRAGEYLVTIVKTTGIPRGGGGYIIINAQTFTPGGTGGFIFPTATATAAAADNSNNPNRVDISFNNDNNNNNNNNKLIIGHETFTIPPSLLLPTPTPTGTKHKTITLSNGDVLPLNIIPATDGSGGMVLEINDNDNENDNNSNKKQTLLPGGSSIILSSPITSLLSQSGGISTGGSIISAYLDKSGNLVMVFTPSGGGGGGGGGGITTISMPAAELVPSPPTVATATAVSGSGSGGSGSSVEVFRGEQDKAKLSRTLMIVVVVVVVVFL